MTRLSRTELKRQLKYLFTLVTVFLTTAGTLFAACTASEKNSYYSEVGSGTSSSVSAMINASGDLVAIAAWCYPSCTPVSVTLGSQSAAQTSVSGAPGGGSPGTGQGFIYYILSTTASGSQSLTFTATGGASQTQVAYIDFSPSAGCGFTHDVDSTLGSGTGGTSNTPSITPTPGDLLFNFTWVTEHVTNVNSPWNCTTYVGGTGDCSFNTTKNADAYILNASSGSIANNMTMIHPTDSWQGLISSFSLSSGSSGGGGSSGGSSGSGGSTYYVAATGSDSNNGTSKTTPWLHGPGMPNCAANCAAHTPVAGDQYVFRGGDTWHFGNQNASPYTGGTWTWSWNGASGNPIYVGVDQSWYNSAVCGSSWCRPILNADNPLSTSSAGVASCLYKSGSSNNIWFAQVRSYVTLDNFEMLGLCNDDTSQPNGTDLYVDNNGSRYMTYSNLYIHGWTHKGSLASCGSGGTCVNICAFYGGSAGMGTSQQTGDIYDHIVVDGADSDPQGAEANRFDGFYQVQYSVFRNVTQIVFTYSHILHDTLFDTIYYRPTGNGHDNVWEADGEASGTNVYYNNVFKNIYPNGSNGNVVIWPKMDTSTTDYWFNNVMYSVHGGGNYFDIGQNDGAQGNLIIYNNTFEALDNVPVIECNSTYTHPFVAANNHYITDYSSAYSTPCTGGTFSNEVKMTHAVASSYGYTPTQAFAYSPTSSTSPTSGTGTNKQSYCSALSSAGLSDAASACQTDTRYACTYSTTSHTVSCPARATVARSGSVAWSVGAYMFGSTTAVNPPTGLVATVQ